jgi:hypothetical protein
MRSRVLSANARKTRSTDGLTLADFIFAYANIIAVEGHVKVGVAEGRGHIGHASGPHRWQLTLPG